MAVSKQSDETNVAANFERESGTGASKLWCKKLQSQKWPARLEPAVVKEFSEIEDGVSSWAVGRNFVEDLCSSMRVLVGLRTRLGGGSPRPVDERRSVGHGQSVRRSRTLGTSRRRGGQRPCLSD